MICFMVLCFLCVVILFDLLAGVEVDDYAVRVAVSLRAGSPSCSRRTRFSP